MPNLVGTPIDQASQILRQLGLNNISLKYEPGEGNINEVIEQSPKAGEEVQTVQTIELTLLEASAESVGNINVPALVNLPLGEAVSRAASEGFVRILIYEEASEENEAGMVIAQVPNESVSETPGGDLTLWAVQQGEPNFFAQYTSEIQFRARSL